MLRAESPARFSVCCSGPINRVHREARALTMLDLPASSAQTRKKLGWQPTHRGLIADLEELRVA
jgi:hypothetical protein